VKPIALHMVQQLAGDAATSLPVSGIGGISGWREAAEFLLLGCASVQVCTAVMHYGFRIVEDMIDGLSGWMDDKGFRTIGDLRGRSLARVVDWGQLDLNYKIVARIHPELCIGCDLCYVACWDGAHQCIHLDGHLPPEQAAARSLARIARTPNVTAVDAASTPAARIPAVDESECVGCNLCWLVCPVEHCITMEKLDSGLPPETWEQRAKRLGAAGR
jgi:dihydropyrimidine dehydrogenase (NAD+) subunit PreA